MKPLRLDKAVELYKILRSHIPDVADDETAIEFIGKIIDSIKDSEHHDDYVDAVVLMSEKDWDEIKLLDSGAILQLFIDGLSINKVVRLKSFFDVMGFDNG